MKQSEDAAAGSYQAILEECLLAYGKDDLAVVLLERLVREEKGHAKMAEELIKICRRTRPEIEALLP